MMHHFQVMVLKKLCEYHNPDIQLIDYTLTYEENRKYLLSLAAKDLKDLSKTANHRKNGT